MVSWQAFFEKDRNILILCICLSAVIWVFNRMSQLARSTVEIKTQIQVPDHFVLSESPDPLIRAGVEGTGWQLLRLQRAGEFTLTLKPERSSSLQEWTSDQLRLRLSDLDAFREVKLVSINPARISVALDSAKQKTLPIEQPFAISYEKGYSNVSPIEIYPKEIQIAGPRKKVSELKTWKLDTLQLNKVRRTQKDSISLQSSPYYEDVFSISPQHITYQLAVSEFTELKRICVIESPADSISLFPRRSVVRMRIPIEKYTEGQNHPIQLGINIQGGQKGSNVPIQIESPLPYWMKNIRISPPTVDYLIIDTLSQR